MTETILYGFLLKMCTFTFYLTVCGEPVLLYGFVFPVNSSVCVQVDGLVFMFASGYQLCISFTTSVYYMFLI